MDISKAPIWAQDSKYTNAWKVRTSDISPGLCRISMLNNSGLHTSFQAPYKRNLDCKVEKCGPFLTNYLTVCYQDMDFSVGDDDDDDDDSAFANNPIDYLNGLDDIPAGKSIID